MKGLDILKNLEVKKKWCAPGASQGLIIDGVYKNQDVIVKIGFTPDKEDAQYIFTYYKIAYICSFETEKNINEKLINKINSPYVVKMINSGYISTEDIMNYFPEEIKTIYINLQKLGKTNHEWLGVNYNKLAILVFEKVEHKYNLYQFKGNTKDWLNILWNVCNAYHIFNKYGLRHNDVNLSNILLVENPDCYTIKIIDYGTSSVQPTKQNNKLKIYNKGIYREFNTKNTKYDLNDFRDSILEEYSKYVPQNIKNLVKTFENKTPFQAMQLIKKYK